MVLHVLRWFPAVLVIANARYLWTREDDIHRCFLVGLGIVAAWLLWLWILQPRPPAPSPTYRPTNRTEILCLIAILALGVVARFYDLESYPPADRSVIEETQTGRLAFNTVMYGHFDPEFPLTNLLGECGLRLFGRTMMGLRIPFVIWSCVGVFFFYLAARLYLRTPLAFLAATLLFATNTYVIASGRTAMETFAPITTLCLAIAATLLARNRRGLFFMALAGAANGLLFIEYFSFRFVGLVNCAFLLAFLAQGPPLGHVLEDRRHWRWRHLWSARGEITLFFAVVASVAIVCWLQLARRDPIGLVEGLNRHLQGRGDELHARSWIDLASAGAAGAKIQAQRLFFGGGESTVTNSSQGIFDHATSWLAIAALCYACVRAGRSVARWWPIVLTVLAVAVAGALTPLTQRYRVLCTLPFLLLILSVPVDDLLGANRPRRALAAWITGVVAVGLAAANLHTFFGRTITDPLVRAYSYDFPLQVALEIVERQQARSTKPLVLLSRGMVDEHGGDAAWLYERDRVTLVESLDGIKGPMVVIACDALAEMVEHDPGFRILRVWEDPMVLHGRYVGAERD